MLGAGVVGGGVYRRIAENSDRFEIVKIMVRNVKKYTDQGMKADILTTEFEDLIAAKPDVFIDVSGGIEPALSQTLTMLKSGVHVVSANKQAIAAGGDALAQAAKDGNAILQVSSSAGGGMPILEMCLREKGRIVKVEALLNGTTNYMLDQISAGASYEDALKDAQDKGFAEADPTADVGGADAWKTASLNPALNCLICRPMPLSPAQTAKKPAPCSRLTMATFTAFAAKGPAAGRQPKPSWRICLIFLLRAHFNLNKRAAARVESLA